MLSIDKFFNDNPDIKEQSRLYYCRGSRYRVSIPVDFSNDLCLFIGIMHGDGNLSSNRILITDENVNYHQKILHPLFHRLFNLSLNLYYDKGRNSYYSHVKSSIIFRFLIEILEFQPGSVRELIISRIPTYLRSLSDENKSHYIAGLYNSEGHFKKRQAEVDFASTSKAVWHYLQRFFKLQDISFSTYVRDRVNRKTSFEIYIYGRDDVFSFRNIIPLSHPEKVARLQSMLA